MFRRKLSIKDKLIMYLVFLSGFAIFIVSFVSYLMAKEALMERTFNQLTSIKTVKNRQLNVFFQNRINDINLALKTVKKMNLVKNEKLNSRSAEFLQDFIQAKSNIYLNAFIIDNNEIYPVLQTDNMIDFKQHTDSVYNKNNNCIIYYTDYIKKNETNNFIFYFGSRIFDDTDSFLFFELPAGAIDKIMLENIENNGLGTSGETYLVGNDYLMRSSSKFKINSILNVKVNTIGVNRVKQNLSGEDIFPDYRDIEVLSSYTKAAIPVFNWSLMVELDKKEALAPIIAIRNYIMSVTIFIALIVLIIAIFISKKFSMPIIRLKEATSEIGKGNLDVLLTQTTSDEIGDLTVAFNSMTQNLNLKNKQLESEKNLRYSLILDAQEKERERLSRELHDNLGQLFTALKLNLENYKEYATEHQDYINKSIDIVDTAIDDIRRISNDLMPSILKEFGLVYAIKNLAKNIEKYSTFEVNTFIDPNIDINDKKKSVYIFRIIQEAVNNSIKHSKSKSINISIKKKENMLYLELSDNGIGFDTTVISYGNGLFNIKERVKSMNGKTTIESEPGKGSLIQIEMPDE